jgi:hypothetical protein
MKTRIYSIAAGLLLAANVIGQAPQKMSYQAVIRNSSNALVTSTPVGMKISVLQGTSTGTAVYVETQTPSTNSNGLVSLSIGTGTVVSGTFAGINWGAGPYFIKTETDPTGGTTYTTVGTNQLMSVPYALFSANGTPGAAGPAGPQGAQGPQGVAGTNGTNGGASVYTIGSWPELGGYVFRISADGKHGLVAATQDQSVACQWYYAQDIISNPSNHNANGQKFMDWRLPTNYELSQMYSQRAAIGGFTTNNYWSNKEDSSTQGWFIPFSTGAPDYSGKGVGNYIRAVRAF